MPFVAGIPRGSLLFCMNEATPPPATESIDGQLSPEERAFISKTILDLEVKPEVVVEVGTWLGGGSTLHILRALQSNGRGHLWGVEAEKGIYERMIANIRSAVPEAAERFTPLLGLSTSVLPDWLKTLKVQIDVVFLDGGGNPFEQIQEFKLLAPQIRTGGVLMSHDAHTRKGKWLVPYLSLLDNWKVEIHDFTFAGLLHARKVAPEPSPVSLGAAEHKLRVLRLEPKELAARFVPRRVCAWIFSIMPQSLNRKLTIEA